LPSPSPFANLGSCPKQNSISFRKMTVIWSFPEPPISSSVIIELKLTFVSFSEPQCSLELIEGFGPSIMLSFFR
jgi:hypothetical protein